MNQSLGLLEVKGLLGAVTMSDVMVKASNVHVVNIDKANGFGWFTVKVVGDVGAVQSAIEAGAMVAKEMGCLVSSKVIPRVSRTYSRTCGGNCRGRAGKNSTRNRYSNG